MFKDYAALAESSEYSPPINNGVKDLENKYWKSLSLVENQNPISPPIYGADIEDTVTDHDLKVIHTSFTTNSRVYISGMECRKIALYIGHRIG